MTIRIASDDETTLLWDYADALMDAFKAKGLNPLQSINIMVLLITQIIVFQNADANDAEKDIETIIDAMRKQLAWIQRANQNTPSN